MAEISKTLLQAIRVDMNAALEAVAKKHGLQKLRAGNCTYTSGTFSFKVEGILEGGKSKEAERYEMGQRYDDKLPPLGFALTLAREAYTVVGMNTTGSKIIVARTSDGKQFLYPREAIIGVYAVQKAA